MVINNNKVFFSHQIIDLFDETVLFCLELENWDLVTFDRRAQRRCRNGKYPSFFLSSGFPLRRKNAPLLNPMHDSAGPIKFQTNKEYINDFLKKNIITK